MVWLIVLVYKFFVEVKCSFNGLTKPGYYPDEKYKFWIDPFIYCKGWKK
jgi:hypothetical protein